MKKLLASVAIAVTASLGTVTAAPAAEAAPIMQTARAGCWWC
ncbi:hypothetical protein [Yimella sp. cx-51]|nr:hypothetical protein [Yimella sp. cx-51]